MSVTHLFHCQAFKILNSLPVYHLINMKTCFPRLKDHVVYFTKAKSCSVNLRCFATFKKLSVLSSKLFLRCTGNATWPVFPN